MGFKIDIINILILFVMVVNSIYGLFIYSRNRKDKVNFSFFILTISISAWGLTMLGYRGFLDHDTVLFMARLLYFTAICIPTAFIYFCFIFPDPNAKLNAYQKYLTPLPLVILCTMSLVPGWFIYDVILYPGRETSIVFNYLAEVLFGVYVVSYFSWAYWIIFKKYLKATGILKTQLAFIFVGTFSSTMITLITNLTLLYFGDFDFNWVGQIGIIVMITFIFYSILKYRLFNIKVIATELFVFSLWVFILVRTFFSDNIQDELINLGLFAITLGVGALLIRSVIREVEQREKIENLAADLEKTNTRLTELDKQKTEFISFATHQLRAPLTAMKGYASLIIEGDLGAVGEKIKDAVSRMFESAKTMAIVVDDYLNVSRIELGTMKYNLEPLNMKDLVTEVAAELKPNIEKAGLKFSFNAAGEGPWTVSADPDKWKQVIANIIDNSVKYTPSGSLAVALERVPNADGTIPVRFSVTDTGIGINPAVMPKLFQKFSRAEGANKVNIHGTGLGLFIAKEIVTAHHGKVWAESEGEGKGSKFIVELPAV